MWRDRALSKHVRSKLQSLIASRQYIYDPRKLMLVPQMQVVIDIPWAFFGHPTVSARNCHLWTKIMFDHFDLVPKFCRFRCHKVVAKPSTVTDLIKLFHFASALPFLVEGLLTIPQGKAGIDRRDYTTNPYSAFWYANNYAHAQQLYDVIHPALCAVGMLHIADTLIIKKACTEMELKKGPTNGDFWKTFSEEEQLLEDRLTDIFFVEPDNCPPQPSWHINSIIESWLDFARTHGDPTGDTAYDISPLRTVTYHHKEDKENDSNSR